MCLGFLWKYDSWRQAITCPGEGEEIYTSAMKKDDVLQMIENNEFIKRSGDYIIDQKELKKNKSWLEKFGNWVGW